MLGFFNPDTFDREAPRFIATTSSAFSLPSAMPDLKQWDHLDCRHGRALFFSKMISSFDLLVWEPLTGERWLVPEPPGYEMHYQSPNAAVVCAVKGSTNPHSVMPEEVSACVYSSVTGEWGEWLKNDRYGCVVKDVPSILIGRNLYFRLLGDQHILEYDLDRHGMALIWPPVDQFGKFDEYGMAEDDGQLGVVVLAWSTISLWSTDQKNEDARWARRWVMQLDNPLQFRTEQPVVGFAEGVNITFTAVGDSIFTFELKSRKVKKYCRWGELKKVLPLVTFYRPAYDYKSLRSSTRAAKKT
ncbi:hypothetical protein EJB05_23406, partial [Eragrostis curvula]